LEKLGNSKRWSVLSSASAPLHTLQDLKRLGSLTRIWSNSLRGIR